MPEEGICLYDIELDGCLNGIYTNEAALGVIYNEIARIKKRYKTEGNYDNLPAISGMYDCFYFEQNNLRFNATLEITNVGRVYKFVWRDLNGIGLFIGVGFIMNPIQISVHYRDF